MALSTIPPPEPILYLDGEYVPEGRGRLPALDRAVRFGDGLFETFRCRRGHVPFLEDHWRRLAASAAFVGIPLPLDARGALAASRELSRLNRTDDAILRLTVTRGVGPRTLWPPEDARPALIIECIPLLPSTIHPMKIHTSSLRQDANSPLPRHKTLNRMERILASREAREAGADEALFLNSRGEVAEGTTMSIFWTDGKTLFTPSLDTNILPGVTRGVLLRLARKAGIPTEEGRFPPGVLARAKEVFVTSAVRGVHPVERIDAQTYPVPKNGLASRLAPLYLAEAFPSGAGTDACAEGACEV